jgi:fatty-acyl-CoA synthase
MQPPVSRTIFALLEEQSRRDGAHLAIVTPTERATYAELAGSASHLASRLAAAGLKHGDRIGLLCDNRVAWLEIFFAAAALGVTVVPFSTWSKATELDFLISDSRVRWIFTVSRLGDQSFAADIAAMRADGRHPGVDKVVLIDGDAGTAEATGDVITLAVLRNTPAPANATAAAKPDDTLVVLYTSGSSSRPKAVPLQHGGAIENGFNIGERMALTPDDRVLISVPLFWSYGVINALPATITHGATVVLLSRFEPAGALTLIERERCTALYTLPAMTSALLAHPQFSRDRTRSLRTGLTIGAAQDVIKAAEELGAHAICNVYGSTECYGNSCVTWSHWPLEQRSQCQGPPLPGVILRIRNGETGAILGVGETGEVEVKGYLTAGYDGFSSRHNVEVFTDDGFFRTGDLGSLTTEGHFVYSGRSSEMIKRSGINVSPSEVEEILQQHDGVGLAGVTGVPDARRGEIIVAYVIPRADAALDLAALLAHCRERLSAYKIPDRVEVCAALPLTPTGKLMRRELKHMATTLVAGNDQNS